jgi:hypothetical protein
MLHVMDVCPTNGYHEKVVYVLKFVMTNVFISLIGMIPYSL